MKAKEMGLVKKTNQSPRDIIKALRTFSSNNAPNTNPMINEAGWQSSRLKTYPSREKGNSNNTSDQLLLR